MDLFLASSQGTNIVEGEKQEHEMWRKGSGEKWVQQAKGEREPGTH